MQIVSNDVYKKVAEEMNKEYSLVKSMGDSVFASLLQNFKKPSALILKLKGIGSFYLRKQKLQSYIQSYHTFYTDDLYPATIDAKTKDIDIYLNKQSQYFNFCDRNEEYISYSSERKRIREIRNQTQPIIEPKNDSE